MPPFETISRRRQTPSPFQVLAILKQANERAAAGGDVLHLEAGQPASPAPARVIEAAREALASERLGYTEALGTPGLRSRIARHYQERYGLNIPARRVGVTAGSSAAFLLSFLACFHPGDRIALADPGYPAYRNILRALDLEPVVIAAEAETGFQPTLEALERLETGIQGLLLASPSNPTGTMLSAAQLDALCHWCRDRGVQLISDEIYHGVSYGDVEESTAAAFCDRAIVINSFSKYYSMTGWRIGWTLLPDTLVEPVEYLAQSLFISPCTLSQKGAFAAFDAVAELDDHVARYRRNRDRLLTALPEAGFIPAAPPHGAFYLYARLAEDMPDSEILCDRLLHELGVAAVPGTDFDPARGHRFIRFSYAGAGEEIEEAMRRLIAWRTA